MNLDFKDAPKHILSANEIRTYCTCARKRYYSSRDCLALRSNNPSGKLLLGSKVHDTLAYYYVEINKKLNEWVANTGEVPTIEKIKEIYDELPKYAIAQDGPLNYELEASDEKVYNNVIACYMNTLFEDLLTYDIIECEQPFHLNNWPIDNVQYHGFIDMVVRDRNTGIIYFYEHKTCKDFRPDIYDRFDIQLHIYDAYGYMEHGENFGGLILNQLKKAKTPRGYGLKRAVFNYSNKERHSFFVWLKHKTEALVSNNNQHEPCNNYMECKMCEYAPICLEYGYDIPTKTEEVLNNDKLVDETNTPMFKYDPRKEESENKEEN